MGLTNEFIQYITTPEEYDRQHYEGGSTIYGPAEGAAMTDVLVADGEGPARRQARRRSPTRSTRATASSPRARRSARARARRRATAQPTAQPPGSQAVFQWQGGPRGEDRPLDQRFIAIERKGKRGWIRVADDLGVSIVWTGDPDGAYGAHWQIPPKAKPGTYRFAITANHYKLRSARPSRSTRRRPRLTPIRTTPHPYLAR